MPPLSLFVRFARSSAIAASMAAGAASPAHAGGHFDVDDAGTLDRGRCQYEAWWTRTPQDRATGLHLGPACRVGPFELGLNLDHFSVDGRDIRQIGPQVKWTFYGAAPDARLSAAWSATVNVDSPHRGRAGGQLLLPVSWRVTDPLTLHANLGVDWAVGDGKRLGRRGLAAEWAVTQPVTLIVERNRSFDEWTTRLGLRLVLTPAISVDLSHARIGVDRRRSWVLGINHEFNRP